VICPVYTSNHLWELKRRRTLSNADQYQLVFDLSQKGFQWWFPAFGLIFVVAGCIILAIGRRKHWPFRRRFVGYFMLVFAWSGLAFVSMYADYRALHSAYENHDFSVVEGSVTNFRPMPYEGHKDECFSVGSETFCYSDYDVGAGFNNSSSHGGPIREGLPVRVSYIGNTIVRLEVRNDKLPSAAERAASAEAAKGEWKQREEHDPFLKRMNLGFAIAGLFMTAWWNVQPQRFMRFGMKPPYKPLTTKLFRVFFAANLIGAIWGTAGLVARYGWTQAGSLAVTEIAAAWIVVMWIMVTFAEWMARKQDQTREKHG
jgi:hypothetical protein